MTPDDKLDLVERVARAVLAARGVEMRALDGRDGRPDALWLCYPKEHALAEARAAIAVVLEAMRGWEARTRTFTVATEDIVEPFEFVCASVAEAFAEAHSVALNPKE